MEVVVNGRRREIADRSTVADLVASLGFGNKQVVVEHNGEAVERSRFAAVVLGPQDVVEVVRPVQGGSGGSGGLAREAGGSGGLPREAW